MVIKISPETPGGQLIEKVDDLSKSSESDDSTATLEVTADPTDPISHLATQLTSGQITGDDAVNELLDIMMNENLAESASPELRAEMLEAIQALIETDPYLVSLVSNLKIGNSD